MIPVSCVSYAWPVALIWHDIKFEFIIAHSSTEMDMYDYDHLLDRLTESDFGSSLEEPGSPAAPAAPPTISCGDVSGAYRAGEEAARTPNCPPVEGGSWANVL